MKGLLVKDVMLLKSQKQFFIVVLMFGVMFLFTNAEPFGAISYVTVLSAMCTVNTMSYDEFENGMGYLFTLPVTRINYVKEKYVFGILTTLFSMIFITVFSIGTCLMREILFSAKEFGAVLAVDCALAVLIFSLQIPVRLKFRAEKSTMAMMAVFAFAGVMAFAFIKILQKTGINLNEVLNQIEKTPLGNIIIICALLALTLLVVSYIISIRIIKKKEF